jgi:hypothetical protein
VRPAASRFVLFIDGKEYPGSYAPPPPGYSIVVRQPATARAQGNYVIEATFAAPALSRPDITMFMDVSALPVADGATCTVEGTPVPTKTEAGVVSAQIAAQWSRAPGSGSLQLSLPHVTVRCALPLQAEEEMADAAGLVFEVWIRDTQDELVRTRAVMPAPAATDVAVSLRLKMKISHALAGEKLASLLQSVARVVAKRVPGFAPEQAFVQEQTSASGGWMDLTVDLLSRDEARVDVEAIKACSGDIVAAARAQGYTVADGTADTVQGRVVDAACSYTCGAGCRLCEDDAACAWDLDCSSGACEDGACVPAPPEHEGSSTPWTLIAIVVAVAVVAATGITVAVRRHRLKKRQEPLLDDFARLADFH